MKSINRICILLLLVLFNGCQLAAQTDYWANLVYFSGCPVNHIPKGIGIPDRDQGSRAIMNAIIGGDSYEQLRKKFPDSLDVKLEKLVAGKVIERTGDGFTLLFPVLTGEKRKELQTLIHDRISGSGFSMDEIIAPLKKHFTSDTGMIFHFLWSRIIDDCWWSLYNSTFHTRKGPPSIAFIVAPPHPYQCGTNSDYSRNNDMLALSWSYNLFDDFFRIPATKSFFDLVTNQPVSKSDTGFFIRYGLADPKGGNLIFTYTENDPTDRLCDSLKQIYIKKIRGLFNYRELGKTFRIPADDLFLVVLHEVAYEIIQELDEKNTLFIPITLKRNPSLSFRYLVSIRFRE
jgi:hypothetical protein